MPRFDSCICRRRSLPGSLATALLMCAVAWQAPAQDDAALEALDSTVTTIRSRGVEVPVTFVVPTVAVGSSVPLVVMAHGHGGSRDEAGAFRRVAAGLAQAGIASIRMDFPGCGDSVEPFSSNNLANMLQDIGAARDYALSAAELRDDRIGLFGYSMGGRAVMLESSSRPYAALAVWAPAGTNGIASMIAFLGGQEAYEQLRAQAMRDGSVRFTTPWAQHQRLGRGWFTDMEETRPLESIRAYAGALLVLFGDEDEVISPRVARAVGDAAESSSAVVVHAVRGAGHGLGFYDGRGAYSDEAVSTTVRFLAEHLNR